MSWHNKKCPIFVWPWQESQGHALHMQSKW